MRPKLPPIPTFHTHQRGIRERKCSVGKIIVKIELAICLLQA